jgi:hypothetical protein
VYLYQGDAVYRPFTEGHPLDPSSVMDGYHSITVLDCAYHFRTREQFLRQSFRRLASGGWIGLADVSIDGANRNTWLSICCLALGVPGENLWNRDRYLHELQMVGFVDCELRDVSESVFPKFRAYLRSRGHVWALVEKYGIGLFVDNGGRYVIVSARKP